MTGKLSGRGAGLDRWWHSDDRIRPASGARMDIAGLESEPPAPGLQRAGARLPLGEYTRRLWHRRWFMVAYATANNNVGSNTASSGRRGNC